ncbi:MAG: response regulator [Chloroflexota bacterium]|nr:response regulator [Chloroflexota bacterium]
MAKILVIEDEFDIREELMNWLQFEGYEVMGAENGRQGLAAIRREHPDLVLCDISMPEIDGHQVLIELRSEPEYVHLPFIFLTASADRDSMRKGMTLGADDYLTKPFTHAEVMLAIRTRLSKIEKIQTQIDHLSGIIDTEREQRLLKSRLVGMFSHDFRNPLAAILSSSILLQRYGDRLTPERHQKEFQRIDGAVHLLLNMLDEMLLVAEIENGQLTVYPETLDLSKLVTKLIKEFRLIDGDAHQLAFSNALPEAVTVDPKFVQHIVTNLISNAIKYSPPGSEIHVRALVENEEVILSVQDAGIGIAQHDLTHVFEPFFRADNARYTKGTGLGLALVKQAVDICGGTISVTSELGTGSCFTVHLPNGNVA